MSFIKQDPHCLVWQQDDRYLWIEAWGENSLRVRSGRHLPMMRNENWALTEEKGDAVAYITYEEKQATLQNGKITAIVNLQGQISFWRNAEKCLLQEFWRQRGEIGEDESAHGQYVSALNLQAREFKPIPGGNADQGAVRSQRWRKVVWHGAVPAAKSGFKRLYARAGAA